VEEISGIIEIFCSKGISLQLLLMPQMLVENKLRGARGGR
jgi:hypothetical protein